MIRNKQPFQIHTSVVLDMDTLEDFDVDTSDVVSEVVGKGVVVDGVVLVSADDAVVTIGIGVEYIVSIDETMG